MLYNTLKNRRPAGIWKICRLLHIQAWIYGNWIVFHKAMVLNGSLQYVQWVTFAEIMQIFYCLAWFDTVETNRRPCPNNKMYDEVVFAYRFRYPLNKFGMRLLIGQSRFHHAHIVYETDTAKINAAFCRFLYSLHDLIRLNSIVCHVQATRSTKI